MRGVRYGNLMTHFFCVRPYLDQFIRTPNRLAFGERTVIVMSSKVAQKSYGTEKRYVLDNSNQNFHHVNAAWPTSAPQLLVPSTYGDNDW